MRIFHLQDSAPIIGIRATDSMADATRSQVVIRDIEEKMNEMQATTEQRHQDVKNELTLLSRQIMEVLHNQTNAPRANYQAPTRFTKMDLPKFMNDDAVGWLAKCESYFDLDRTSEEKRVTMASLMLDEISYQWYDGLRRGSQGPITWQAFADGIRVRFGTTLRRPLEELVQLKQTGSLSDYRERFERIACRSNLTKD